MGLLPTSREAWREELAWGMIFLAGFVAPFPGGAAGAPSAGILYAALLADFLSEWAAMTLSVSIGLIGSAILPRPVLRPLFLGILGVLGLSQTAEFVWGSGTGDIVIGLGIVLGFLAVLYVFGEGKAARH